MRKMIRTVEPLSFPLYHKTVIFIREHSPRAHGKFSETNMGLVLAVTTPVCVHVSI